MSENNYLALLKQVYEEGYDHGDRTGTGRRSVVGTQTRFNISDGSIPVVTTRKIYTRAIIAELLWFIRGSTDNAELNNEKVNIWNKWAVSELDIDNFVSKYFNPESEEERNGIKSYFMNQSLNKIGPMYGAMWRNAPRGTVCHLWPKVPLSEMPTDKLRLWEKQYEHLKSMSDESVQGVAFEDFCNTLYYDTVDQLNELVRNLKERPYSSRLCVTAWIPEFVPFENLSPTENVLMGQGALAACHAFFQCFVKPPKQEGGKKRLSLQLYIRSQDLPIGNPYNVAQYSILLAMLAHVTDMEPSEFILTIGDCHIYLNQLEGVQEQITRQPLPAPKLWLNPEVKSLFDFKMEDIEIQGYQHLEEIKYPVSV